MARKRSTAELGLDAEASPQKKRHLLVDGSDERELSYEGKSNTPLLSLTSANPTETANMSPNRKASTSDTTTDNHVHQKRTRIDRESTPENPGNYESPRPTKRKAPIEHPSGREKSSKKPRVEEENESPVLRNENAGEAEAQTAIEEEATEGDAEEKVADDNDQTGVDPKAGRNSILWEQLKDIVFLKENFVADPSDPSRTYSLTTGPRTNQQLVDEYNKLWGAHGTKSAGPKDVVAEACMKRYRRDKADVYTAFPGHPRTIVYANKSGNRSNANRPVTFKTPSEIGVSAPNVTDPLGVDPVASEPAGVKADKMQSTSDFEPSRSANAHPQTDREHHHSAKGIERDHDFQTHEEDGEDQSPAGSRSNDSKPPNWVRLVLVNKKDKANADMVVIRDTDLRSSRIYREEFDTRASAEITIRGFELDVVRRYADCISPKPLSSLPELDFSLKFTRQEEGWGTVPCVKRIEWTLENTIALYELASLLEDDHVRNLIIDHWNKTIPGFVWDPTDGPSDDFEESMGLVFDLEARLPEDRLLRRFWKRKMSGGPHPFYNYFHDDSEERYFHRRYHHHEAQTSCHLKKHGLFAQQNYKATHFRSLAKRLLLSKPLSEKSMENGFDKVGNALRDCLEWAKRNL